MDKKKLTVVISVASTVVVGLVLLILWATGVFGGRGTPVQNQDQLAGTWNLTSVQLATEFNMPHPHTVTFNSDTATGQLVFTVGDSGAMNTVNSTMAATFTGDGHGTPAFMFPALHNAINGAPSWVVEDGKINIAMSIFTYDITGNINGDTLRLVFTGVGTRAGVTWTLTLTKVS